MTHTITGDASASVGSSPRRRTFQPRRRFLRTGFIVALPFLLPALALYLAFVVGPIINSIRLSFYEWPGYLVVPETFVGLDNYVRLFTRDPVFWTALQNTIVWALLSLIVPTILGLLMALALNRPLFGRNLFRTVFYIPGVLAPIAIANIWRWIYNPDFGVFRSLGDAWGWEWLSDISWLGDPTIALYSIFVAFVWQVAGLNMVLFLAGLQGVPAELTDAARVDGANHWQVFRHVTLPALRPTIVIVVVLTLIHSIKVFDLIVGMTGGGPAQSTQVLSLWSYTQSFINHDFGMGSAVSTVLLVITLVLVVPYLVWTNRGDKES